MSVSDIFFEGSDYILVWLNLSGELMLLNPDSVV